MPMKPRGQGIKVYKISKDGDNWKLVAEGGSRATFVSATRIQAVKKAERLLSGKMAEVLIHDPRSSAAKSLSDAVAYPTGSGLARVSGPRLPVRACVAPV